MQTFIAALFGLFMISPFGWASSPESLASAKAKYPYTLLGDDFGILNESDLAANTCDAYPKLFSLGSNSLYWRCFESNAVTFSCDSSGIADPNEGVMGLIVLNINNKNARHEYLGRRPWPIVDCREFGKKFASLTKHTRHVCISGSSPGKSTDPNDTQTTTWIFEKYKTSKGCESYFEGDCDLTRLIKRGCKPSPSASG
jgi:hypothetical protein